MLQIFAKIVSINGNWFKQLLGNLLTEEELKVFVERALIDGECCSMREARRVYPYLFFWVTREYANRDMFLNNLENLMFCSLNEVIFDMEAKQKGEEVKVEDSFVPRFVPLRTSVRFKDIVKSDKLVRMSLHDMFKKEVVVTL